MTRTEHALNGQAQAGSAGEPWPYGNYWPTQTPYPSVQLNPTPNIFMSPSPVFFPMTEVRRGDKVLRVNRVYHDGGKWIMELDDEYDRKVSIPKEV